MGLLLNGAGNLMTEDIEKLKVLNAFFAYTFRFAFRNPRPKTSGEVQSKEDLLNVGRSG